MDITEQILVVIMVYVYIHRIRPKKLKRKRDNMPVMSGHDFTLELLTGNNEECTKMLRMSSGAYIRLSAEFRVKGWLKDSTHISVEEKMAIFLFIIGHNQRYVVAKRRFQHSLETIHKCFHEVLDAMMEFAKEIIVPTSSNPNPDIPKNNRSLRQNFQGAVGAIDGTLISAIVPVDKQTLYRGRGKGDCYQKVLAICDFNMIFTFVLAGWEGVVDDSRVLSEVVADSNSGFPFPPPDKYYLCDAKYPHTRGFMTPYRNVRHHLGDFNRRPAMNKEEKFNNVHAELRNVIERAYGVLKERFPILKKMAPFSLNIQRDIVISCFAIHNFIRKEGLSDDLFNKYDQPDMMFTDENAEEGDEEHIEAESVEPHGIAADLYFMTNLREEIAVHMMQNESD